MNAFVCIIEDFSYDLMLLAVTIQFAFSGLSFSSITSSLSSFNSTLWTSISAITPSFVLSQAFQTSFGTVAVSVTLPSGSARQTLIGSISAGLLNVAVGSNKYIAVFNSSYGPCATGSISSSGNAPNCMTCVANTFVCSFIDGLIWMIILQANEAQTICLACPAGTASPSGSGDVSQCISSSPGLILMQNRLILKCLSIFDSLQHR